MEMFKESMENLLCFILRDCPEPWQLGLQDAGSVNMEECVLFHDEIMFILTIIIVIFLWLLIRILTRGYYYKYLFEGTLAEVIWTLMPILILIFIAIPSLKSLYLMEGEIDPSLTVKATGHQWYWSYEYLDYNADNIEFDSYMVPVSDLNIGDPRLLEVNNRLILPVLTKIRILVTGADVLHAFSIPSMGLKLDAVPGRLNQVGLLIKRCGVFYGQCSELCGANHSFMPIVVECVTLDDYIFWTLVTT